MDLLIYIANFLYRGAYFARDALLLRLSSLLGAICLVEYFASRPYPLGTIIAWNLAHLLRLAGPHLRRYSRRRTQVDSAG